VLTGSAPNLKPERSTNFTVGADFTPSYLPGLVFSVNYYDIKFRDRIQAAPFDVNALLNPSVYGSLITPLADDAAAQAYLDANIARGLEFLDFLGSGAAGVRDAVNLLQLNAAHVHINGVDLQASYHLTAGADSLDLTTNVAYIKQIETEFSQGADSTDILNTYGNPIGLRSVAGVTWTHSSVIASGAINFAKGYTDTTASPPGHIGSYSTVDLNFRYSPSRLRGLWCDVSLVNALNRNPPHTGAVYPGVYFDAANASPMGRMISVEVGKRW
jgi:outer membrane receptor protein involved in Fe transport